MKKSLSTVLFAILVFVGTGVFAQEPAMDDAVETFATEYMPETKALLDQIRKIRKADLALHNELVEAARIMETADYLNGVGLKNDALLLLMRKIRAFNLREGAIVKTIKELAFKHRAGLVEADACAAQDVAQAKDGTAWLASRKDCRTLYELRLVTPAPDLNAAYLVVDLETLRTTSLAEPPATGWSDDFKTDALVLSKVGDFWIGVFEVTQRQWEKIMFMNPSSISGEPDSPMHPVEGVTQDTVMDFCNRLNAGSGIGRFNLLFSPPTKDQWILASGGFAHDYTLCKGEFGYLDEFAWADDKNHHVVGTKKPNVWGLYDMAGNVFEVMKSGFYLASGYQGYPCIHIDNEFELNVAQADVGFRVALVPMPIK